MGYCRTPCLGYILLLMLMILLIQYLLVFKYTDNPKIGEKFIQMRDSRLKRSSIIPRRITSKVKRVTNEYNGTINNISFTIHSSCSNLKTKTFNHASSGKWIPVGVNRELYVFSAFYEKQRNESVLTGINRSDAPQVTCQVWYVNGTADVGMEETPLNIKSKLPESRRLT